MDVAPDARGVVARPERRGGSQPALAVDQPHILARDRDAPPVADVALVDHPDPERFLLARAPELGDLRGVGVGGEANVEAVRKR